MATTTTTSASVCAAISYFLMTTSAPSLHSTPRFSIKTVLTTEGDVEAPITLASTPHPQPLYPITSPRASQPTRPSLLSRPLTALKSWTAEAHPHARTPSTLQPHAVDLSFYTRRLRRTAALFVPVAVVVFGWPFVAKGIVNAKNGVWGLGSGKEAGKKGSRKWARKMGVDDEAWAMKGSAV